MLASISPLGERARGSRWSLTVAAHVVGSAAGGALAGAVLGLAGSVLPVSDRGRGWLVIALLVVAVAFEVVPTLRLPTIHRQVDEGWLGRYRGWVYGVGYGFQLGLGAVTIVTTS